MNPVLVELNDLLAEIRSKRELWKTTIPSMNSVLEHLVDWAARLATIYEKLNMEDKIRGSK